MLKKEEYNYLNKHLLERKVSNFLNCYSKDFGTYYMDFLLERSSEKSQFKNKESLIREINNEWKYFNS